MPAKRASKQPVAGTVDVDTVLAALKRAGTAKYREGLARYGIEFTRAYGVPMGTIQKLAKGYGKSHALALALWDSGWYEARMMAAYVDEPARVTSAQMDRWCAGFDSWAICDTHCFALFDKTPFAFAKIDAWAVREEEYVKRAAFALIASVALHDKTDIDSKLRRCLPICEAAATDNRNFVKKGVSWAVRTLGHRNAALHAEALAWGKQLAGSAHTTIRWIGKDVVKDLERPSVAKKVRA